MKLNNPDPRLYRFLKFTIIKELALWADSFYKSKCPCVCLSVTLCIHGLNVFVPPLPKVQCQNFLDIRNPWGKVLETSGLRFENFYS